MQYYKEYNIKTSSSFGILSFIDESFIIGNEKVTNNRGIINDIVYFENDEVIGIKERCLENIVGILYLDSKIKYGSIKDKQLLLFKPTNKCYPNFYIPFKNSDNVNRYSIIQFKEWKITDKCPLGTLVEIIGKVGDKDTEFEYLRNYFKIKNNIWKIDNNKITMDKSVLNNIQSRIPDYEIFSIDPLGSTDIDDAFHYKKINDNTYEVGIHIASPSIFFENNIELILNRVSTIYMPNRKYNMLPNIYADNLCSLLENTNRFALSLILIIINNKLESYKIVNSIVKNICNYNYDQFDKIMNKKFIKEFVDISKSFFEVIDLDSHKLVENWMIYSNKLVASYLIEKDFKNIILRKHEKNEIVIDDLNNSMDNNLYNYLNIRKENSALYEIYDKNSNIQMHSKLGNIYYTHFTSPIRRSIDLFIHLLIINNKDIYDITFLQKIIENINNFTKNSRKCTRMMKRLDFLYSIKEKEIISYGFIINIGDYKITIYIPEYNLEEKIIIVPRKFGNIIDSKDKMSKYKLYERIEIKLWVFTTFDNIFDKLKIEII